ncbi:MAG: hypothetical protein ACM3JP_02475 [Betaproteobacteria bacterium]
MLTRDVSHAVHIDAQPVVVASMVLDVDTGLVRGMGVAESGRDARAQASRHALTRPAGTLPPGPPARVLCGPGDAQALTGELATLLDAPAKANEVVSVEAEDIFDSFVGHMAGRHQPEVFATPDDWARLIAAAEGFRQAPPWLRRADDRHLDLVVRVAGVAARYLAIVLGQEGVQRGLILYPGPCLRRTVWDRTRPRWGRHYRPAPSCSTSTRQRRPHRSSRPRPPATAGLPTPTSSQPGSPEGQTARQTWTRPRSTD